MNRRFFETRSGALLLGILPIALFLALYWRGLWCWFHTDDFSLLRMARLPADEFFAGLLEPRAQGTYRPLSERLYFYFFYGWFGLNAFPYRVLVFVTQGLNLVLFSRLAQRLTGSQAVGVVAASLWALHHGLATTMSWSSAYNQALCSLFFLLAIGAFARWVDEGRLVSYASSWVWFLVGFGALETMAVFPAVASLYSLLRNPKRLAGALPMFAVSAAAAWLQLRASPPSGEGVYGMSFAPLDLLAGMWAYTSSALGAELPDAVAPALAVLLGFAVWRLSGEQRNVALLGLGWFALCLIPYLPLTAHRSAYYLFLPVSGLALAGALALAWAWKAGPAVRWFAVVVCGLYLFGSVSYAVEQVEHKYRLSIGARDLATGVSHGRARHPNKTLLLTNLDNDLFYASVYHDLFPLIGVYDVYLAPDLTNVRQLAGYAPIDRHILPPEQTLLAVRRGSLTVYNASSSPLRAETTSYRAWVAFRLDAASGN